MGIKAGGGTGRIFVKKRMLAEQLSDLIELICEVEQLQFAGGEKNAY